MTFLKGKDAAFPHNIDPADTDVILGYLGGPNALHTWTHADWARFGGHPKIPIWVGGQAGEPEGFNALQALFDLRVPPGAGVLLDLETRVDRTYVSAFGEVLQWAGFKVWPYGSTSTLFQNPMLNGYAVADPTGVEHMYPHPGVRITQYAFEQTVDDDAVRHWLLTAGELWK